MKDPQKEEEYIRQFINELGAEKPSPGFHKSIVKRLGHSPAASVYRPVVSPLAWKVIGGAVVAIIVPVLIFLPLGESSLSLFDQVPEISIPRVAVSLPKISFPAVNLSPIVLHASVAFLLLAFLTVMGTLRKWKAY